ncbi:MAG: carbohydrate-binding protein, partial [Prevotella shahii]|nr:carbohydrate-binding protein [Hoylesella shahii]
MKKINLLLAAASSMLFLASCDSYLDKLPADRAELNTIEKVQNLLSTAYPAHSPDFG